MSNIFIRKESETSMFMCRKGSSCGCPKVEKRDGEFYISDDFGGTIRLPKDEFYALPDVVKEFPEA